MANMQEEKIALEEVIPVGAIISVARDVLRRWYIIVTAALIAAMAAFVYADVSYTPQYTTTTTFVVTSGGTFTTTYQNLSATAEAAGVFTEILNSSLLREKVTEETGITDFDGTISASVVSDTNILNVHVRGSDARTVYLVTRAMIDNHTIVSGVVLGSTALEVLQQPVIPTAPSNSKNTGTLMKMAMVLAVAASTALLAVQAWMADKVRSRAEADRKLDCRVLGELYHERKHKRAADILLRRKTSILITNPLTSFTYSESIHKLSGRIDKLRHRGEHVVMVTSLLENEGKSTVAVNLALSWAGKGRKVLLIDADLRKPSCHKILNLAENDGMIRILQDKEPLSDHAAAVPGTGLFLVAGGHGVRNASTLLNSHAMEALLKEASARYDLVVVDTPPMGLTPDAECISEFADCAVLVAQQNSAEAGELNRMGQNLEKSGIHLLGCVLNNVYGTASFAPAFQRYGYGYGKYGKYYYGKYGYGYGYGSKKKVLSDDEEKGAL